MIKTQTLDDIPESVDFIIEFWMKHEGIDDNVRDDILAYLQWVKLLDQEIKKVPEA